MHELEFLLTEAVAKGIKVPKRDGTWGTETIKPPFNVEYDEGTGVSRIVLTNPEHQLHVLAEWVRGKRFGLRSCVTKAQWPFALDTSIRAADNHPRLRRIRPVMTLMGTGPADSRHTDPPGKATVFAWGWPGEYTCPSISAS